MTRMEDALDQMQVALDRPEWDLLDRSIFRILYGQPLELQVDVARWLMGRYLPIYESHWPNRPWARQLLQDPLGWRRDFGREVPVEGDEWGKPGDSAFELCFDALLLAYEFPSDPLRLTSSCACAVRSAIDARMQNVWGADDPEAFELMKKLHTVNLSSNPMEEFTYAEAIYQEYISRNVFQNVAAQAVRRREWTLLLEYLRHLTFSSPPVEPEIVERHLEIWEKDYEGLLIPPKLEP